MININSNKGLITIDERLKQIRIVSKSRKIMFIDISENELNYIQYWKEKNLFKIVEEVLSENNIFRIKCLEVLKGG